MKPRLRKTPKGTFLHTQFFYLPYKYVCGGCSCVYMGVDACVVQGGCHGSLSIILYPILNLKPAILASLAGRPVRPAGSACLHTPLELQAHSVWPHSIFTVVHSKQSYPLGHLFSPVSHLMRFGKSSRTREMTASKTLIMRV